MKCLWMPGTDHAGIATQNVVERQLQTQGISKGDLGREEFLTRVWKWKQESGGTIISQLKRLGCSCDWKRERFTMDEGLSLAVRKVFVNLFHEGLIYRGDYMIHWCPRCESALADLEVEYPDDLESGFLYRLAYPIIQPEKDGVSEILVDTTRPETMLGDTAVAVHPDDNRYKKLIGKEVKLPIIGRVIPIIADDFVDPEFGSGAVKITPGHDPNDFDAGKRHALPIVSVIGFDGRMTKDAGSYMGLDRFDCREKIIKDLQEQKILREIKPHQLKTGRCYRCHTVTEPLVSTQWFMRMRELADEAIKAVRDKRTTITPVSWEATYFQWLNNIRDWCISRQLWWGHQIPVWYCDCGEIISEVDAPKHCPKCKSSKLRQDPDVLDTWFSSALWPFSTMGWPENTPTLKKFYPTSVLVTGFDIIFFWVARMMMLGLKCMGDVPFREVYLHAMVRDEHGQKMSKTKGNVIDPLELINDYGADALRFSLAIMTIQGRDVNVSKQRIEGYRNFINKLWNATRFVLMNFETADADSKVDINIKDKSDFPKDTASCWIRSRLASVIEDNLRGYDKYEFSELCSANYRFFWDEFCAWYLEISKIQLKTANKSEQTHIKNNLLAILDISIRLLYPTIPFVCEELWHELPMINGKKRDTLTNQAFPTSDEFFGVFANDQNAEAEMDSLKQVVIGIRNLRTEHKLPPGKLLSVIIDGPAKQVQVLLAHQSIICGLARLDSISTGKKPERAVTNIVSELQIWIALEGVIDKAIERARIEKEINEYEHERNRVHSKLSNASFMQKAPKAVIDKERAKLEEFEEALTLLRKNLLELSIDEST
jgi:valyl-tRNA synthetase